MSIGAESNNPFLYFKGCRSLSFSTTCRGCAGVNNHWKKSDSLFKENDRRRSHTYKLQHLLYCNHFYTTKRTHIILKNAQFN
jgi:hypothetical protein